ncbi:hypothetical protein [Marinobacterium lutimaris]|uniref:Uncharacterized conserved protein YcfJ, contains glycine zipper 2TM domain n=1 Tax=Marinobacterium lutimaris TaxID=568106 RepID=A0A1H6DBW8_9GAMM|nr:hypothetical protein [Marinobacterium lutimaris]SEG82750.1 Uncharacterized conserved protein YcfJ, contains glycine zipper 2TM domain [Marinobacterium lutimaris]
MNLKSFSLSLGLALSVALTGQALAGPYDPYQGFNGRPHYDKHGRFNSHDEYPRLYERYDRKDRKRHRGQVLDVKPIWGHGRHSDRYYEDCRDHRVDTGDRDRARIAGALAGAAVGGLIGREHDNSALGAVAGALAGVAGGDILVRQGSSHRGRECIEPRKLKYHQKPVAYLVRYRYRDRIYTTRTREHPGRYIRIN